MIHFIAKALADIRSNRFLNFITITTIALSILTVSLFLLFFENAGRVMEAWNQGGRAVVYLKDGFKPDQLPGLKQGILALGEVVQMTFVPREKALEKLKAEMGGQTAFLDTLEENPLPHALDIQMADTRDFEQIRAMAEGIAALEWVESVEYGQGWLGRFLRLFNLFKITGYIMGGLFLLIALFISANTARLAFYARQREVEIMRLVGATEGFIKAPFYVEGMIQGLMGAAMGLLILLGGYTAVASGLRRDLAAYVHLDLHFLSIGTIGLVLLAGTALGWFGCYLSLKQILK